MPSELVLEPGRRNDRESQGGPAEEVPRRLPFLIPDDWPAKCRPIIARYGIDGFVAAARKFAVHECFAAVFTTQELLAIDRELSGELRKGMIEP